MTFGYVEIRCKSLVPLRAVYASPVFKTPPVAYGGRWRTTGHKMRSHSKQLWRGCLNRTGSAVLNGYAFSYQHEDETNACLFQMGGYFDCFPMFSLESFLCPIRARGLPAWDLPAPGGGREGLESNFIFAQFLKGNFVTGHETNAGVLCYFH